MLGHALPRVQEGQQSERGRSAFLTLGEQSGSARSERVALETPAVRQASGRRPVELY